MSIFIYVILTYNEYMKMESKDNYPFLAMVLLLIIIILLIILLIKRVYD